MLCSMLDVSVEKDTTGEGLSADTGLDSTAQLAGFFHCSLHGNCLRPKKAHLR
jgi:hypothetical protein